MLLIQRTVARAVDKVVDRLAVAPAGDLRLAIGEQLDIARQHHLDRAVHPAMALREGLLGLDGDLRHGRPPGLPGARLEPRSTCLFPRDLFECYHDTDLHSHWTVVVLAVGESLAPQRPLCLNMTLLCVALALARGSSPLCGSRISA